MSQWEKNEPCPSCREQGGDRKGNNLGVFDDGHMWCWSCGYYVASDNIPLRDIEKRLLDRDAADLKAGVVRLPYDASLALPSDVCAWLSKYGITDNEIADHNFMWSDLQERLIFPVYGDGFELLFYQGRSFSKNPAAPKYLTRGQSEDVFHVIKGKNVVDNGSCVLTEDLISAIKVSRQTTAMPLWGSHIGRDRLSALSKMFFYLSIWLDNDKLRESMAFRQNATVFFDRVTSIVSDLDPKEYNDSQIQSFLTNGR
jgi:hypothetical protein